MLFRSVSQSRYVEAVSGQLEGSEFLPVENGPMQRVRIVARGLSARSYDGVVGLGGYDSLAPNGWVLAKLPLSKAKLKYKT